MPIFLPFLSEFPIYCLGNPKDSFRIYILFLEWPRNVFISVVFAKIKSHPKGQTYFAHIRNAQSEPVIHSNGQGVCGTMLWIQKNPLLQTKNSVRKVKNQIHQSIAKSHVLLLLYFFLIPLKIHLRWVTIILSFMLRTRGHNTLGVIAKFLGGLKVQGWVSRKHRSSNLWRIYKGWLVIGYRSTD